MALITSQPSTPSSFSLAASTLLSVPQKLPTVSTWYSHCGLSAMLGSPLALCGRRLAGGPGQRDHSAKTAQVHGIDRRAGHDHQRALLLEALKEHVHGAQVQRRGV